MDEDEGVDAGIDGMMVDSFEVCLVRASASAAQSSTHPLPELSLSTELPSLYPLRFSACPPQRLAPLLADCPWDGSSTRVSRPRPDQQSRARQQAARHWQAMKIGPARRLLRHQFSAQRQELLCRLLR